MKPLTEKMLSNGIIDKATAELMEKMGLLAPGSAEKVNEDAMKNATLETLKKFTDDVHDLMEKDRVIRETRLDLERIRWPVVVDIHRVVDGFEVVATMVEGVIDRTGRYYFRAQDVEADWFVAGYEIARHVSSKKPRSAEVITEKTVLYVGDEAVCLQISTMPKE